MGIDECEGRIDWRRSEEHAIKSLKRQFWSAAPTRFSVVCHRDRNVHRHLTAGQCFISSTDSYNCYLSKCLTVAQPCGGRSL